MTTGRYGVLLSTLRRRFFPLIDRADVGARRVLWAEYNRREDRLKERARKEARRERRRAEAYSARYRQAKALGFSGADAHLHATQDARRAARAR